MSHKLMFVGVENLNIFKLKDWKIRTIHKENVKQQNLEQVYVKKGNTK